MFLIWKDSEFSQDKCQLFKDTQSVKVSKYVCLVPNL